MAGTTIDKLDISVYNMYAVRTRLYEQITQPCSSQYPAYHFHLGWISGLIFSVGIVIVIIAAIKMIRSKRRQQRQERQEKEEGEGGVNI